MSNQAHPKDEDLVESFFAAGDEDEAGEGEEAQSKDELEYGYQEEDPDDRSDEGEDLITH